MHHKPILIVPGQINSIFFEIFFKSLKKKKFRSPLVLICSIKIFKASAKKYKFKGNYKIITSKINEVKLNNKAINIIDVNFKKIQNNNYRKKFSSDYLYK